MNKIAVFCVQDDNQRKCWGQVSVGMRQLVMHQVCSDTSNKAEQNKSRLDFARLEHTCGMVQASPVSCPSALMSLQLVQDRRVGRPFDLLCIASHRGGARHE